VYYITQAISLAYKYEKVNHSVGPNSAIAVLRVLPNDEWTQAVRTLLSASSRAAIDEMNKLATSSPELSWLAWLPAELLNIVCSFAIEY
jgi:hypothetical protein